MLYGSVQEWVLRALHTQQHIITSYKTWTFVHSQSIIAANYTDKISGLCNHQSICSLKLLNLSNKLNVNNLVEEDFKCLQGNASCNATTLHIKWHYTVIMFWYTHSCIWRCNPGFSWCRSLQNACRLLLNLFQLDHRSLTKWTSIRSTKDRRIWTVSVNCLNNSTGCHQPYVILVRYCMWAVLLAKQYTCNVLKAKINLSST